MVQSPLVPTQQQFGVVNWQVARPPLLPVSYVQGAYGPVVLPLWLVPVPTWGPYPGRVSPVASPTAKHIVGAGSIYGVSQLSPSAPVYPGPYQMLPSSAGPTSSTQKEHSNPERPGQLECQYYVRTGECKFGSTCRYHHPREWISPRTNCVLSLMGLPLHSAILTNLATKETGCWFGTEIVVPFYTLFCANVETFGFGFCF
ncbi:zinc finger CCCH domain-containing protein 32-like [Macadamia integrifolia]|uniref:zinc finger CCCH domain-containing protein 32-like n=1 Tax=Macadamia integrifolia TaxID=60698 RepID=UPI001C4E3A6A|nr:zinc finger CCCH domain-containing protein 32-like [Macadamia integrifolia]